MSKTTSGSQVNEVSRELSYIRKCPVYGKVKDLPEMQAILAKYEPFAGEKRDYTKE
jgi:hypothetical protein